MHLYDLILMGLHLLNSIARGHGTYFDDADDSRILASVAGRVERVNKLIYVRPLKTRLVVDSTQLFELFYGKDGSNGIVTVGSKCFSYSMEIHKLATFLDTYDRNVSFSK